MGGGDAAGIGAYLSVVEDAVLGATLIGIGLLFRAGWRAGGMSPAAAGRRLEASLGPLLVLLGGLYLLAMAGTLLLEVTVPAGVRAVPAVLALTLCVFALLRRTSPRATPDMSWQTPSVEPRVGSGGAGSPGLAEAATAFRRDHPAIEAAARHATTPDRLLRLILDNAPASIAYITPDRRYVFANHGYETAFGWPPESIPGRLPEEVLGPAIAAEVAPHFARACTGETVEFAHRLNLVGGERHHRVSYVPDIGGDGHVRGVVVFATDITEIARRAEEAAESEARFRALIETTVDAIIVIDETGIIQECNPATERLFGYSRDEMVGRNVKMLMPEPHRSRHDSYLKHYLETGEARIIGIGREVEGRRKDGSIFPTRLSVGETRLDASRVFIGTLYDLTEERHTHNLLTRRAREVEEANAEMRNFTSIVSHDLKAPLVNIKGFGDVLDQGMDDLYALLDEMRPRLAPEEAERIDALREHDIDPARRYIASSAEKMSRLIEGILAVSRVGRVELDPAPVDVDGMVRRILETMEYRIEQAGIEVELEPLPTLETTAFALEQILANLLDNAIKYLDPERPGRIKVRSEETAAEVRITVEDNGRGMTADELRIARRMFGRVDPGCVEGSGLGLTYADTFARRLGGRIDCRSEKGVGSRFDLVLPRTPPQR